MKVERQKRVVITAIAVGLLAVAVGGVFVARPLWLRFEVRWCLAGLLDDDSAVRLQSYRRLAEELDPEVIPLLSAAHPRASPELKPLIAAILRDRLAITLKHPGQVLFASFHPSGDRIVTGCEDGAGRIWDVGTGELLKVLKGHSDDVWYAAYSPDGTRVILLSDDEEASLWNPASGEKIRRIPGHKWDHDSADFSPDSRWIVMTEYGRAQVYDARTGAEVHRTQNDEEELWYQYAAYSPDGKHYITTTTQSRGVSYLWNADTHALVRELKGGGSEGEFATFSPDGSRVVVVPMNGPAPVWSTSTGEKLFSVTSERGGFADTSERVEVVVPVSFSPDGKRLATASNDGTVGVWDVGSGERLLVLKGHDRSTVSAIFSASGRRILSASQDDTARIWDAASGEELLRLEHGDVVYSAHFSPDGETALTASRDGTARLWPVDPVKAGREYRQP